MAYNYIISSDDKEAAFEKVEEIKRSFTIEYDYSNYDLEEEGIYKVIDELTTISLFDTPKFIVVSSFECITSVSDKAITELLKAMNHVESENVIIFTLYKSVDYANPNVQKIKKYASWIDIKLKNIPIDEYIMTSLQQDGYEIDKQALTLWMSYQEDLASVKSSLEQLKCYTLDRKKITDKDIQLLIASPLEDNVYQLVEAVLNAEKKRMFKSFKDLKLQSVQPSYLVSLLINKFQELYNVSILLKSNSSQNDIASIFNVSSGRAYYMMKNAKSTNINAIRQNLEALNALEYNIKSGKIDQNLGLELYFLK